ncbi:uncharacterized protein BP5553_01405 [Venustampulla echinocandica]|uniref:Uncharacterized protein n=1 Tax=Venustampulla echinocandica TaxID=2656787 RepID=A0A370U0X4_9HELO|nr:uncharacterized protein BP5553_01405 [Venustampulla echinocandica]RDL41426.1 hypothetical protein BP5553_01405 [Venustampulla echinocandica]
MSDDEMQRFASGDFASLGLPAPSSMPTPAEAQQEARERSTEILERHEDVLWKRWIKKTKVQRTAILLRAWPNMSSTHRPDYEALRKEGPQLKSRGTRFREAYIWPYINVEDLVRGKTLLLFLNSRGRHSPSLFAHTDFEAMRLGNVSTAVMPAFLNLHTMLLDGETIETYGRLVSWDDDEDAMMKVMSHFGGYQPGEGLLILEAQQRILLFLLECCHGILHDSTPSALTSEGPIKPEPPLITDSSEWPTLASIAVEAPYRLPAQLDFVRLKALVAAKCTSAEDHIRGLREDPGYFADVVGDWSEHRQEKLLDTNKVRHPVLDKPLFWDRVIGNVVVDAYGALIIWDIISEQLTHLAALQENYSDTITPQKILPPEYMKALLTFRYMLEQTKNGPISLLKTGIPASPPPPPVPASPENPMSQGLA